MLRNCSKNLHYKSYAAQGSKLPPYEFPQDPSTFKLIQANRTRIKAHLQFPNFQVLDFANLNSIILISFLYTIYYKGSNWIRKELISTSLQLVCSWALFTRKSGNRLTFFSLQQQGQVILLLNEVHYQ